MRKEGNTGALNREIEPTRDRIVRSSHRAIAVPEGFRLSMFIFNKSLNCSAHP
jgi:hypothetical protein